MVAAHIATSPTFAVTSRDTVFADRFLHGFNHRAYDLSPDGKTFVMIANVAGDSSLTVIANWRTRLRARSQVK